MVYTSGDKLVLNHLLEHDFLSHVLLESLLKDLAGVPLTKGYPFSMRTPPWWAGPGIEGPAAPFMVTMLAATPTSTTPISCTICRSSKGLQIVSSTRGRRGWGGMEPHGA